MLIDIQGLCFHFQDLRGYEPDFDAAYQDPQSGILIPGVKLYTSLGDKMIRTITLTGQSAEVFRAITLLYQNKGVILDGATTAVQYMQAQAQAQLAQNKPAQEPAQKGNVTEKVRNIAGGQLSDADLKALGIGVPEAGEPVVQFSDDDPNQRIPPPFDAS